MSVSRKILKAVAGLGKIDPNFADVSLLLHGDGTSGGQNNTFLDGSTNNFTLTRNGNTTQGSFNPYSVSGPYDPATHGGSGYFDGSGDYLTAASNAAFGYGTGDFTIEFFIYFNSLGTTVFFDQRTTGTQAVPLLYYESGNLTYYVSGATRITGGSLSTGTWYHIALCRSGTSTRMFVDGVQVGSTYTDSTNYITSPIDIGARFDGTLSLNGYFSDVRVVKGTALYTASFTPPTAPLTAVSGTELLCNFTNAAIFDSTAKNVLETVGNAQIDTSVKKYGTGSMEFDGTGDYLVMPITQDLQFGSGDFTIEGWINVPSVDATYRTILSIGPPVQIYARSGTIEVYFNDGDNTSTYIINGTTGPASSISANTWAHFAVVRNGTTFTVYVDGVAGVAATGVSASVAASATRPAVGIYLATTAFPYTGYIDDLRITKGVARYTAAFTPPVRAFPDR